MRVAMLILAGIAATGAPAAAAHFVESRAACQVACGPAVERYCVGLRPAKYRTCRARTWKNCRRFGVASMCAAPTTTTLPPPVVTTTTTTTVPRPSTTTTTQPQRGAFYEGTWEFTGSVTENSCPTSVSGLQDYVTVDVQIGGNIIGTIDSVPGVVLIGSFPNGNNDLGLEGTYYDQGCSADIAMVFFYDSGGSVLDGAWGTDITCGYNSCRVIWVGTWLRLS
jgi:hypothetical protein